MDDALTEKLRINELFDAYGKLLTEKQRRYVEYYFRDDYSLSEVAGLMAVSRNAVHVQLGLATAHMEELEAALGLVRIRRTLRELTARLDALGVHDTDIARLAGEIDTTE